MPTANDVTIEHIARVQEHLGSFCMVLEGRGLYHDRSKFTMIEAGPLQEMQDLIDKEGPAPFGTEEYSRRTKILGPMLAHHYALNPHHPEHYPNGMSGMNLFDLVEMFADWKAAGERGGDQAMNLTFLAEKYKIDPMLLSILKNTCDFLEWQHV